MGYDDSENGGMEMKLEYVLELGLLELVHGLTMSYENKELLLEIWLRNYHPILYMKRETTSIREMHTLPMVIK